MRLEIKSQQHQGLALTPALQQAIAILQMPQIELAALIQAELEQNPLLDWEEEKGNSHNDPQAAECDFSKMNFAILDDLDDNFNEAISEDAPLFSWEPAAHISLYDHLMQQAREVFSNPAELNAAEMIIGGLDERGFCDQEDSPVLHTIQTFDPPGIAARTLQESLLIQLRLQRKQHSPIFNIIADHLQELLHNQLPLVAQKMNMPCSEISRILQKELPYLSFSPASKFIHTPTQPIIPDAILYRENQQWKIDIEESLLPKVKIKPMPPCSIPEDAKAARTYTAQGKWLLRAIRRRNETLKKVVSSLVKKQEDYFLGQSEGLRPITLKELSEECALHESTIARTISNKFIATPIGIVRLKDLFSSSLPKQNGKTISSTTVKEKLRLLIQQEDRRDPLTDDQLSKILLKEGVRCSRRTVAKYRSLLKIPPHNLRRSWG